MVAAGASALSLGGSRGAVVIGSPVDLSFDVQPDPGSDVASSCVAAQLVAGDTPIGASRVRVSPQSETAGRPAAVRVQTSSVIEEPVLTVTITAGCTGKVTRSYTFLADPPGRMPSITAAGPLPLVAPPAAVGAVASRTPAASDRGTDAAGSTARNGAAVARSAPASRAAPPAASARTPRAKAPPAAQAPAAVAPGPRLVLEPLDLWLEGPVALRSTQELMAAPVEETSPRRAEAAAAWRALNARPEDMRDEAERERAQQTEATEAKAAGARDRAAALQAQQQLDAAYAERFSATVVYVLGALLVLALGLAAWMWRRSTRASDQATKSWGESVKVSAVDSAAPSSPSAEPAWEPMETLPLPSMAGGLKAATGPGGFFKDAKDASAPAPLAAVRTPAPPAAAVLTAKPPPVVEPVRALQIVNPDDLFDIQQQAEFFISVGEHNQAVDVLRKHIQDHRETTPVAYLELLRLFHTLSRAEDFMQLRAQFMRYFNAKVPEFSAFNRQGRPLDRYPDALAEIEAEWSSPAVLHTLDKFLFHRAGNANTEPFDLAAYDDLLLLLGIAQTTPSSARGAPPPRKRTTPVEDSFEATADKGLVSLSPADTEPDFPLDSLAASLEFDFGDFPASVPAPAPAARHSGPAELTLAPASGLAPVARRASSPAPLAAAVPAPSGQRPQSRTQAATYTKSSMDLDVDLSEPLHLTLSDLPAVPVTPPPPPGQAVGFGAENDLLELRLELEQRKDVDKK